VLGFTAWGTGHATRKNGSGGAVPAATLARAQSSSSGGSTAHFNWASIANARSTATCSRVRTPVDARALYASSNAMLSCSVPVHVRRAFSGANTRSGRGSRIINRRRRPPIRTLSRDTMACRCPRGNRRQLLSLPPLPPPPPLPFPLQRPSTLLAGGVRVSDFQFGKRNEKQFKNCFEKVSQASYKCVLHETGCS
jgi:hypothetical protein